MTKDQERKANLIALANCIQAGRKVSAWHVQAGTPFMVLKELDDWERIEMVQKYAHLAPTHLAKHAETVAFWSQQDADKEKAA